jgi:hypothetical protein
MRRWKDDKDVWHFKGSVFVVFPTVEAAEKFLKLEDLKINEEKLDKKWKSEWSLEKAEEIQNRREKWKQKKNEKHDKKGDKQAAKRKPDDDSKPKAEGEKKEEASAEKNGATDESSLPAKKRKVDTKDAEEGEEAKPEDKKSDEEMKEGGAEEKEDGDEDKEDEEEDEMGFFKGSVFKITGIPTEKVHVRDIRGALNRFGNEVDCVYVAFENGDAEALVRLRTENSAQKVNSLKFL